MKIYSIIMGSLITFIESDFFSGLICGYCLYIILWH